MVIDWDDEADEASDPEWNPPVYGPEGLRIMREQCDTCIFRPGNRMHLQRGRLADMVRRTQEADTNVTCHKTLGTEAGALCRGSVDAQPGQMARIGLRLGAVVYVDPPDGA